MAEPHATVVAGALAGAGASSAVTLVMGVQVDALVIGLIGAVLVSIWLETIDNRIKAAAAVFLSAMLAGYGSPLAAQWIAASVPSLPNTDSLRLFIALLISAIAPSIVPLAIKAFGSKVQGGCKL
jgi:uncharacterized phage infection (PIP) family protein YhgE